MAEDTKPTLTAQLDEMALKIMLVEPGDLSVVGELVVLIEGLLAMPEIASQPALAKMAAALGEVIGKIVMAELEDSAENYERLGQGIGLMQEVCRKQGADEAAENNFHTLLGLIGYLPGAGHHKLETASEPPANRPEPPPADHPAPPAPAAGTGETLPPRPRILESPPVETMDFLQDLELLTGFVGETLEHLESIEVNVLELEDNPGDLEIVNKIFRPFHTIKGVAGFLNLKSIQKLAHSTENLLDDVRNGSRPMDAQVVEVVLKVGDFLKTMVDNLSLVLKEGPERYLNYDISGHLAWVEAVRVGQGQAPPAAVPAPSPTPEPAAAPAPVAAAEAESPSPPAGKGPAAPSQKAAVGDSIKVDVEKLDGLVNAVGELVIMQAMIRANPRIGAISDPKLIKDFAQLGRITTELQKTAMSMRMVPIRQTFQKMIRLVRDLSKKTGKEVNLVMEGEETEIDRNMVDSIYDPLVHMIRNSVDHGVQPPAEREGQGKPRTGTVNLRAYQKGGNMVIEIEDDGQGLNTDKIRRKAIERGLIQESDKVSAYDLHNLIFLPGFSTADKITDVSGRGVGMDVVKKAVEKLRGKVEVLSEPGKGSLFVIRLPLTLAIIDGIIVRVGAERYIIPTTAIQESLKPLKENYNTVQGRGETLLVRGTVLPIIRLYQLFRVEPTYSDPCQAIMVVVEYEGRQRAIMVDELLGKQEVVIKNLGGLSDIPGVAGGTILGDGRVGLILDLAGIVQSHSGHLSTDNGGDF
ncbi:MAG: chemotaxis protein CheA [Desulfobacteraceae bacterium]|nr:chemotaxis protein CheA [Desulfobacteraceae bacterium]